MTEEREQVFQEVLDEALSSNALAKARAQPGSPDEDALRRAAEASREEIFTAAVREEQAVEAARAQLSQVDQRPPPSGPADRVLDWLAQRPLQRRYVTVVARAVMVLFAAAFGLMLVTGVTLFGRYIGGSWIAGVATVVVFFIALVAIFVVVERFEGQRVATFSIAVAFVLGLSAIPVSGFGFYWLVVDLGMTSHEARVNVITSVAALTVLGGLTSTFSDWLAASRVRTPSEDAEVLWERRDSVRFRYRVWREVLLQRGMIPFLRQYIDEQIEAAYEPVLTVDDWSGVWQTGYDAYHVETEACREVTRIMEHLDGGSIAFWGPRGAGKTHLIRALCAGRYSSADDITLQVPAPVDYSPREFVLHLDAMLCRKLLERFEEEALPVTTPRARWWWPWYTPVVDAAPRRFGDLTRRVRQHQQELMYVLEYSSEVSAKAGVLAVEASGRAGTVYRQEPRTYPEVIESFRDLLQQVTAVLARDTGERRAARIVIGIDELDRIDSPDRARAFLSEIKGVFGVPGCFYLVAVSDEALADFDERGRFRASFDNTFDEIVRVDRLDVDLANQIFAQRTTGMSQPFRHLAYCLSGGQAREMLRIARAFATLHTEADGGSLWLAEVSRYVVHAEVQRLGQLVQARLAPFEQDAAAARAMAVVDDRQRRPCDAKALRHMYDAVLDAVDVAGASLRTAAVRLLHLQTVLEVFTDELTQADVVRGAGAGTADEGFGALALARQRSTVSPLLAWRSIDAFRRAWGLEPVPLQANPSAQS